MKNDDFSWNKHELKEPKSLGKIVAIPILDGSKSPAGHLPLCEEHLKEDAIVEDFKGRISMMLSDRRCKKE
ncbi:hypothetical protein [Methanococcoides burtonii]|uniref:hypothetical protein n=1 Tax=Methanococcoides burtonii TaxID=29291 RepID=UPI000045E00C|nr:hypothetical protein [Methanococcoides burtonii]